MGNVKIYIYLQDIFVLAFTTSEISKFIKFVFQKVGQGHGIQFFAITTFGGKCPKSTNVFWIFFALSIIVSPI